MNDYLMPSGTVDDRVWDGRVRFPDKSETLSQNEEWCEVQTKRGWKRIRFHDYASVFEEPGLYEYLFCRRLRCRSPARVVSLLADVHREIGSPELRVLDLGAGNGIVGARLHEAGIHEVHGVDIVPAARAAALRDRPDVYRSYHVADMTQLPAEVAEALRRAQPNCLTCVAALGFSDIPPEAFVAALRLLPPGGLVAFNIKEAFIDPKGNSPFAALIEEKVRGGVLRVEATRRYVHRLSLAGMPLHYVGVVATKIRNVDKTN